jgi:hypothetical protein
MSAPPSTKDLIVIVPDGEMESAVDALLSRSEALRIRPISSKILRHLQRDAGCRSDCHNYLRPWMQSFRYAMVLFDHEGCGREDLNRSALEEKIEATLSANGWDNRSAVITIAPGLEAWVWSESREVDEVLGWKGRTPGLRDWVRAKTGFWSGDRAKPDQPKEAFEAALREARKQRSPTLYRALAQRVSISRCDDPSFLKFKRVLREWFPK